MSLYIVYNYNILGKAQQNSPLIHNIELHHYILEYSFRWRFDA